MFDFSRLIDKYAAPFTVIDDVEGYYDQDNGGVWVSEVAREIPVIGAVLPLTSEELKYDQNGTYTTADKKIFIYLKLKRGQRVIFDGKEYTVQEEKNYSPQAGVYIYYARRAGV